MDEIDIQNIVSRIEKLESDNQDLLRKVNRIGALQTLHIKWSHEVVIMVNDVFDLALGKNNKDVE